MSTPVPPRRRSGPARGQASGSTTTVPPRPSRGGNRGGANRGRQNGGGQNRGAKQGRQAAFQRRRRQQQWIVAGVVALVVVVVAVFVVVHVTRGSGGSNQAGGGTPASASILSDITSVTPATLASVAKENPISATAIAAISAPALTENGKPKIVYIGAEYCPYCGGERWAMIMALSKFGTFHGIEQLTSSSSDDPTSIPTFSFLKATFTSPYLVFDSNEIQDVNRNPLQTPSAADTALEDRYGGSGGIPFVDIGGKWVIQGASYDVTPMQHLSHDTVAQAVKTGSTKYAADIQSTAGAITSRLCALTDGKPGNVCRYFPSVIGG